jgi:hypothetical protein
MTSETLSLNTDSIHRQVKRALCELYEGAENIRLLASALEERVGESFANSAPEELRLVAAATKAHVAGLISRAVGMASSAERLETMADVRDSCEPGIDD